MEFAYFNTLLTLVTVIPLSCIFTCGYDFPTRGEIRVCGRDICLRDDDRPKTVGFILPTLPSAGDVPPLNCDELR
jgi:hypothetical protein